MCELTDLAGLTGAAPGGSQCGAALRLQRGSVDVDLAAVVLYRQPARTLHTVCGAQVTTLDYRHLVGLSCKHMQALVHKTFAKTIFTIFLLCMCW